MTTIEAWRADVDGRQIDRDGAYGAQCWDLAADYAERVAGCPVADFWTLWAPGNLDHTLVSSMWLYWPVRAGIAEHFTRLSKYDPIKAGDVLIWARSAAFPDSHIAIALEPAGPNSVYCMTQNPGAAQAAQLTLAGLLGIFRPIANQEDDMTPEQATQLATLASKAGRIDAIYDALFKTTPTSLGTPAGVLRLTGAIYDALFIQQPTSRGTPEGVLGTLRVQSAQLDSIIKAMEELPE